MASVAGPQFDPAYGEPSRCVRKGTSASRGWGAVAAASSVSFVASGASASPVAASAASTSTSAGGASAGEAVSAASATGAGGAAASGAPGRAVTAWATSAAPTRPAIRPPPSQRGQVARDFGSMKLPMWSAACPLATGCRRSGPPALLAQRARQRLTALFQLLGLGPVLLPGDSLALVHADRKSVV